MPSKNTQINLILSKEGKKALELMVEREGLKSVSDLIRSLLTNYCQSNGVNVDFRIGSWGGKRRKG